VRDVKRDASLPLFATSSGVGHGERRVPLDSLTMKRRLHDAASHGVQGLFCREEAIAEERLRALKATAFYEPVMMRHEHIFNRRRVIEEKGEAGAEPKRDDLIRALG